LFFANAAKRHSRLGLKELALVHKLSKAARDAVMKSGEKYFGVLISSPLDSRLFGRFPATTSGGLRLQ
jgi:hypothetical protein